MASYSKRTLLRTFFQKNKTRIIIVIIIGFLSSVLKILIPVALAKYYSLIFEANSRKVYILGFLPKEFTDTVPHFLIFFFFLILIKALFDLAERYGKGSLGEIFLYQIREILFYQQLRITQSTYDEKGTGRYLLRYSGDLGSLQKYVIKGIVQFIIDFLFLMLIMTVLFAINPMICLIILGFILIAGLLLVFVNKWLYSISIARRNKKSTLLSFISIHLRGILSVKTFNKETVIYKRYVKRIKKILALGLNYHFINSLIQTITNSIVYIMLGGVLVFVHASSWQSQSELLLIVLLLVIMLPLFRRLLRVYSIWELGHISFTKLLLVMNLPVEADASKSPIKRIRGNQIVIRNLSYKFGEELLFNNLNLRIPSKSMTLIFGKGKTTFAKLLLGIYKDYKGIIKIGKTNIRYIAPKIIRKKVTIISADWPLYDKTVFEAISYSNRAIKKLKAAELLEELQTEWNGELDLDMPIGELGQALSYNQYVLLCFARALLTEKKIILVDVQFQNIEPQLREHLIAFLNEIKKIKTVLVLGYGEAYHSNLEFDKQIQLGG